MKYRASIAPKPLYNVLVRRGGGKGVGAVRFFLGTAFSWSFKD